LGSKVKGRENMSKLKIAMFYGDKLNSGQYDNGVWMDILKIPFIQKIEEAENYDVIIRTLWVESTVQGWSREIRKRWPHIIQIGLNDHPLSTHISKLPAEQQVAYIQDLGYLDGLMALTEEERQWYQVALPNIPVIKGGLPFPFEAYTEKYSDFLNSKKYFIGLGVGASDNDRNFISSALVMSKLRLNNPDLRGLFLSLPSYQISPTSIYADYFEGIYLHERTGMEVFYERLSQCLFVINLADRNTPGRIQGEGAFFGVPVIGSDRLELQHELFPDLTTSPYSLEEVVGKAEFLLENPEAIEAYVKIARKNLERYNYRRSRSKFNKLLNIILEKKSVQGV
jgi:hypothetical protein